MSYNVIILHLATPTAWHRHIMSHVQSDHYQECVTRQAFCVSIHVENILDVNEVEAAEDLGQAGYHWAIASRVVIELKQWGSHQLVVPGHGEESLLRQLDKEQSLVLLGPSAVGGDVGVLGGLEVGSPPVGHHVLHRPLCLYLLGGKTPCSHTHTPCLLLLPLTPSSLPSVLFTILSIPSTSPSPGCSSPLGSLKNVVPDGLGPAWEGGRGREKESSYIKKVRCNSMGIN